MILLTAVKAALMTAVGIILVLGVVSMKTYLDPGLLAALLINMAGVYTGCLLVGKQLHIKSAAADRICSMFNKSSDCSNVLESKAAKFLGVIDWSELGLGYFISNTFLVLFMPHLMPYLALLSIGALSYMVWSIWYQKVKAKQWCPLCLIVQAIFVLLFVSNLLSGFIRWPEFLPGEILALIVIYAVPFLSVTLVMPLLVENAKIENTTHRLNSLKMDETVFDALLKRQPRYDAGAGLSRIRFGNPSAEKVVTIVSNPHCNPCSKAHPHIDRLIDALGESVCVQFIFLNFKKEHLKNSGKFLISAYLNNSPEQSREIFNRWFDKEKGSHAETYRKYGFDMEDSDVIEEQARHEAWCEANKISETPTILVNGYRLPGNYEIDDLINL